MKQFTALLILAFALATCAASPDLRTEPFNTFVGALTPTTLLNSADKFPIVQSGSTKSASWAVVFTSPTITGGLLQTGGYGIIGAGNVASLSPPAGNGIGLAVGWNFSNGGAEVDFINRNVSGGDAFRWYLGAASPVLLMRQDHLGALFITPDSTSTNGLDIDWTGSSTFTSTGSLYYNFMRVSADHSMVGSGAGQATGNLLQVEQHYGGSNAGGQHVAGSFQIRLDQGATSVSNTNRSVVGAIATCDLDFADSGSGAGCFGMNILAANNTGANNSVSGVEFNIGNSGTLTATVGVDVVKNASSNPATSLDAAIIISGGPPAWACGICFSDYNSNNAVNNNSGVTVTGTLMGVTHLGVSWPNVGKGIDLTGLTFTTAAFMSKNFTVDGSGNLTSTIASAGTVTGTTVSGGAFTAVGVAGVDCASGIVATTTVVHKGIITHC